MGTILSVLAILVMTSMICLTVVACIMAAKDWRNRN